jgi:hypothetical protein
MSIRPSRQQTLLAVAIALLLTFGLLQHGVAAQQGTAALQGRVVDQQGATLPGATIVLRGQDTGLFRESISGPDGSFSFQAMTPGLYVIEAELTGFQKFTESNLRLETGKTTSTAVTLRIGGVTESLVVTAEAPIIDVTSKAIGGYLSSSEINELPSINRNFTSYLALLPGAAPSFNTTSFGADSVVAGGQSAANVNYALDGGANNDSRLQGGSGAQVRMPIEAIQEFQFLTGQFDAEFGGASGGIVNAVTKQGTNAFHGSAFAFLKDSTFTAQNYFARQLGLAKPDTTEQQWGGTIGGPIVRDHAHFFASLERVVQDTGFTVNIPARAELNQAGTIKTRVWNVFGRFDHQINANHTWGLRWLWERSPQRDRLNNANASATTAIGEDDIDQIAVFTLNSVLTPRVLNTFRASFTGEQFTSGEASMLEDRRQDKLLPQLQFQSFTDQAPTGAMGNDDFSYLATNTLSWFVPDKIGSHDFKIGVEYNLIQNRRYQASTANGAFLFSTDAPFDPANPRTYPDQFTIRLGDAKYLGRAHFGSAYAQDKWRLDEHLTLSVGVRYDLEIIPVDESDSPQFSDRNAYPVDANNVAPRVGFTYDPRGEGHSVIRGGYGRFFQHTSFGTLAPLFEQGVNTSSAVVAFPANNRDPGPAAGRLPAEPLLQGGPNVNRALLNQLFPSGGRYRNTGVVTLDDPDRRLEYTDQVSIGMQQRVGATMALSADYVNTRSRGQLFRRDLNPGVRVDTSRTGQVTRVDPAFVTSLYEFANIASADYHALQVQFERRFSHGFGFRTSYTLSSAKGNNTGTSNFQFLDDLHLDLNEGPLDTDRRHNLTVSANLEVPKLRALRVSAVSRYLSGLPFSIIDTSSDPDRNGILFDPLPAGAYSGAGPGAITVDNKGGRNGARGPDYYELDMRFSYAVHLAPQRAIDAYVEVLNVTDRANFANPNGDRRIANFLVPTAIFGGSPTRTMQVGVRLGF